MVPLCWWMCLVASLLGHATAQVRLSGVTMDDADQIYYMTFTLDKDQYTPEDCVTEGKACQNARLFRVDAFTGATRQAEAVDTEQLDIRDLQGSGGHLYYHNGVIASFLARTMTSGHQGTTMGFWNASTLEMLRHSWGTSHSFGHTMFISSDDEMPWVTVEVGEADEERRTLRMERSGVKTSLSKNILGYKGFSNNCYIELAHGPGMIETPDGIVVLFASEMMPLDYNFLGGWDWGNGNKDDGGFLGYGYNGPKNLGFLKVSKDMLDNTAVNDLPKETGHYYSNWLNFVKARKRPATCPGSGKGMDVTASGVCHDPLMSMTEWEAISNDKGDLREFENPGVLWLTSYGSGPGSPDLSEGAVHRPKMARPCENRILLIWEVWQPWTRTEYMVVDDDGAVITPITTIDVRLMPTDDVSVEGEKVITYVGNEDGSLTRYEISGVCSDQPLTVIRREYPLAIPGTNFAFTMSTPDEWNELYGYFGMYSTYQHFYHVSRSDGRKGVVFQDGAGVNPARISGTSKVYVVWFAADFTSADPPIELQSQVSGPGFADPWSTSGAGAGAAHSIWLLHLLVFFFRVCSLKS